MNPVFVILVLLVVIAGGEGEQLGLGITTPLRGWAAAAVAFGPPITFLIALRLLIGRAVNEMDRTGQLRALRRAETAAEWLPWLALANHVLVCIAFDWVGAVRAMLGGNLIILDEIIAVSPPLLALAALWWVYFPVVRRLREATMLRRLDEGIPLRTLPTRGAYVLLQARLNILLMLVPILIIIALGEMVDRMIPVDPRTGRQTPVNEIASFGATLLVLLLSPLLARVLLAVRPLPNGEVRDDLLDICHAHGVRVREILLWDTHGSMINGAVMGFLAPLRYVLLTDALIESMRRDQLRAVMAHEIGHVRRRHMPWLLIAMLACLIAPAVFVEAALIALNRGLPSWGLAAGTTIDAIALILTLLGAFTLFGWISRRYERQADTFAVQHLSGVRTSPSSRQHPPSLESFNIIEPAASTAPRELHTRAEPIVTTHAATAMQSALEQVARLNAISPRRRSWRHGSILSRQLYLATLIGHPARILPIDRQIRNIKLATAIMLILSGSLLFILPERTSPQHDAANDAVHRQLPLMAICISDSR